VLAAKDRKPAPESKEVLVDRVRVERDQVIAAVLAGADQIERRADSDRAAAEQLLATLPPAPIPDELAARAYHGGLAARAIADLDLAGIIRHADANLEGLLADPQKAAAWADLLDAIRGPYSRAGTSYDPRSAAVLAELVDALRLPALPPDRQAAMQLIPALKNVTNLARFVRSSAAARVHSMIVDGSGTLREQINQTARDQYAGVWKLGELGGLSGMLPNVPTAGLRFASGADLSNFLNRAYGLRGDRGVFG